MFSWRSLLQYPPLLITARFARDGFFFAFNHDGLGKLSAYLAVGLDGLDGGHAAAVVGIGIRPRRGLA